MDLEEDPLSQMRRGGVVNCCLRFTVILRNTHGSARSAARWRRCVRCERPLDGVTQRMEPQWCGLVRLLQKNAVKAKPDFCQRVYGAKKRSGRRQSHGVRMEDILVRLARGFCADSSLIGKWVAERAVFVIIHTNNGAVVGRSSSPRDAVAAATPFVTTQSPRTSVRRPHQSRPRRRSGARRTPTPTRDARLVDGRFVSILGVRI